MGDSSRLKEAGSRYEEKGPREKGLEGICMDIKASASLFLDAQHAKMFIHMRYLCTFVCACGSVCEKAPFSHAAIPNAISAH